MELLAASALVKKVNHSLPDVRNRALESLNSKLRNVIASSEKLARETDVCQEVLRLYSKPALLTKPAVELLQCFVECRESFLLLHVLGLEDVVRAAAENLDAGSDLRARLNEVLATILSASRDATASSSSYVNQEGSLAAMDTTTPRIPSFTKDRMVTASLDRESFRHLPKLRCVKLDKEAEQLLFEISFRLEHSQDEFSLLATLQDLSQHLCRDYPCHAILQQKSLFDNLLRLLHLKVNHSVLLSAVRCLHTILRGFKDAFKATQNKDILVHGGGDKEEQSGDHLEHAYPKAMYVLRGEGKMADDVIDVASHAHTAILHLLSLLSETKIHYQVIEPIYSAIDLLRYLGKASTSDACYDRCISDFLGELEKVFEKHSTSWAELHQGRDKGKSFWIDVFDQNLVFVAAEVLKLRQECDAGRLVPQKMQAYLCKVFNNECIGMCVPDLSVSLFPYIQQIDSTLTLKKEKSKEVLKKFLHLSKDLKALRITSKSNDADRMKSVRIILDILPTVIGMGDTAYFDHIFKLILHLLMRSNWSFVESEGGKPEFYTALQSAFLTILSKSCLKVRMKSYKIWLDTIKGCGPNEYKVVMEPLSNPSIMSIFVVYGLKDKETTEDVSQILLYACKTGSVRSHVTDWLLWLECYKMDSAIGPVIRSIIITLGDQDSESAGQEAPLWSWRRLRHTLYAIFSQDKQERINALDLIYNNLVKEGRAENMEKFSYLASSLEYKFPTPVHLNMQQDAEGGEVQTLMSIFMNEKIDVSIQKSSAIQLLLALGRSWTIQEVSGKILSTCAKILVRCASSEDLEYDEEYLSTVLQIIAHVVKEDGISIPWFTKQSEDFLRTFSALLYHSSISIQQNVAAILFSVIFGEERSRLARAGLSLEGEHESKDVLVAGAFEGWVKPPSFCAFLEVCPGDGNFDLVEEIASKVRDTIGTRNAIKALLGGEGSSSDLSDEIRLTVKSLHPQFVLERTLSRVKGAESHEECESLILDLLNYCSCNREFLRELASMNWFEPFQILLSSAPTSRKDWGLWSLLYTLISKMIVNSGISHTLLMNLVLLYEEAMLPSTFREGYWESMSTMRVGIKAQLQQSSQASILAKKSIMSHSIHGALEMFVTLVKANRASGSIAVQKYMVDTLVSEETIGRLAEFAMNDTWDCSLRTITMNALVELLMCYLDLKALDFYKYTPSDLDSVFSAVVPSVIKNICSGIKGGQGIDFRRNSLEFLKQVTNLARESWVRVWVETDCTFWISKLLRDQDSLVRKTSLQVLCALSNPVSSSLISMLNKCWRDRLYTIVQIAFDERECDLVRAKAMQILSLALVSERDPDNDDQGLVSETYPTSSSIRKSIYQTIEEHRFWDILKNSLEWNRSQLMGGFLSMIAEMLVSDAEYVFQKCRISQICKVATAVFNSCSKHLDQSSSDCETYFDTVIPQSMALNVLQILLQKEKVFPKVLHWIPSMNVCNIYFSLAACSHPS